MLPDTASPPSLQTRRGVPGWAWLACGILFALGLVAACGAGALGAVAVRNSTFLSGRSPIPVLQPASADVLFQDNFGDPASGWDEYDDAEGWVRYEDGSLHLKINEPDLAIWSNLGRVFEDFAVEVSGHQVEGPSDMSYGVLFRYQDEENFYEFDVAADGFYSLVKYVDGEATPIIDWTESGVIQRGQAVNRLRVDAQGEKLTLYVNGELLASVTDSQFQRGTIGLLVASESEAGGQVAFDNLQVRRVHD